MLQMNFGMAFALRASVSVASLVVASGVAYAQNEPAQGAVQSDPGERSAEEEGGEIIVTAQKRDERLIDVPIGISALSGDTLDVRRIRNALDLSRTVPSLTVTETAPGAQIISIRGIGGIRGSSSLTGLYLDEVPVSVGGQFNYTDVRSVDLARVEVLKGPQGTLFGEGSVGGTIRYITNDADLSGVSGSVLTEVSTTDEGGWNTKQEAVANVPLSTTFGMRLVGSFENNSGWIDMPTADRRNVNDNEIKHLRFKTLFEPSSKLRVTTLLEMYNSDIGASNVVNQEPFKDSIAVNAVDRNGRTDVHRSYEIYNLTARYDLGFAEILSATSHFDTRSRAYGGIQVVGQVPDTFLEIYTTDYRAKIGMTTQEFRLTSRASDTFNWTVGGQYKDLESTQFNNGGAAIVCAFPDPTGPRGCLFLGDAALGAGTIRVDTAESWAGFADASLKLGRWFEIGGGGRYFDEKKTTGDISTSAPFQSGSFNAWTYRAFAKFTPVKNLNVYVNTATGFRSGGFNTPFYISLGAPPTYGVEKTTSYEAGLKTILLNGAVRANVAAFYTNYSGMQDDVTISVGGTPIQFTDNGQNSRVKGFEWEVSANPIKRLTLGFAGSIVDTRITKLAPSTAPQTYLVGDPINLIPRYNLNFNADYSFNWAIGIPGNFHLDYSRIGKMTFTEGSNILIIDKQITVGPTDFVNASLDGTIAGWKVSIFARNLLNEWRPINAAPTGWRAQARPRTFGLQVSRDF